MEWAKTQYNKQYDSWVPWLEDIYLRYFTRDNKASYKTRGMPSLQPPTTPSHTNIANPPQKPSPKPNSQQAASRGPTPCRTACTTWWRARSGRTGWGGRLGMSCRARG